MREKFKSFYYPTQEELLDIWKNEKTVFAIDANVLLNLYSYQDNTRADLFKLFKKIKVQVFIPHHAALEYQKNRIEVISKQRKFLRTLINQFKQQLVLDGCQIAKQNSESYEQTIKKYPDLKDDISKFIEEFNNSNAKRIRNFIKKFEDLLVLNPQVNSIDTIRTQLDNLNLNIGSPFTQDELDIIYQEGENRYKELKAPGFKDEKKEEVFYFGEQKYHQKYGDLIIWKQIIKHVKENNEIENVIFISDDTKDDWIEKFDSEGEKIIGAKRELKCEIYQECLHINQFLIHNSKIFLDLGNQVFKLNVKDESIKDVNNALNIRNHKVHFDTLSEISYNEKDCKFINKEYKNHKKLIILDKVNSLTKEKSFLLRELENIDPNDDMERFFIFSQVNKINDQLEIEIENLRLLEKNVIKQKIPPKITLIDRISEKWDDEFLNEYFNDLNKLNE